MIPVQFYISVLLVLLKDPVWHDLWLSWFVVQVTYSPAPAIFSLSLLSHALFFYILLGKLELGEEIFRNSSPGF